jgi:hypothetical protein
MARQRLERGPLRLRGYSQAFRRIEAGSPALQLSWTRRLSLGRLDRWVF